jgi:hypothetical protein
VALVVDLNRLPESLFKTIEARYIVGNHTGKLAIFSGQDWILTWTSVTDAATIELAVAELKPTVVRNWEVSLGLVSIHAADAEQVYMITDAPAVMRVARVPSAILSKLKIVDASFKELAVDFSPTTIVVKSTTTTTTTPTTTTPTTSTTTTTTPTTTTPTTSTTTTTVEETTVEETVATTTTPASESSGVKIVGHIYMHSETDASLHTKQRLITVRGYAGIIVTLHPQGIKTQSDLMGEFHFEHIPVGQVRLSFDVPPGMTPVVDKTVALREGGVNRIPPVELKFDEQHQSKINHVKVTGEWSTEGITVVVLASVVTLVATIWVIVFCIRQQKLQQQQVPFSDQVLIPEEYMKRQIGTSIQHHGLKKRV